jgi:esterase/lipase
MIKSINIKKIFLPLLIGLIFGILISNCGKIFFYSKDIIKNIFFSKQVTEHFSLVEIPSTYDKQKQKIYFYATTANNKMPLIVSLHPWSSNYSFIENESSLAELVRNENWNYLYPDFRGKNDTPESCLSDMVIQDIDDAIAYAIENANVDTSNITVVGLSGGGLATLGVYLKSNYQLKYCMAWCPISDLEKFYYQSKHMGMRYWEDLLTVTNSEDIFNSDEVVLRSPLYMAFDSKKIINNRSSLEIYAGINDGYTGSVPISHSILFYNRIAEYLKHYDGVVSDSEIIMLLSRTVKGDSDEYISGRKILYKKSYPDIGLFIFDGTHEILPDYAFDRIKMKYTE